MTCIQYEDLQFSQGEAERSKLVSMLPDSIVTELNNLDAFETECRAISSTVDVGVFRVDLTPMKSALLAQIASYKEQFHRLIPDLYSHNGDRFYVQVSQINDVLSSEFSTLE